MFCSRMEPISEMSEIRVKKLTSSYRSACLFRVKRIKQVSTKELEPKERAGRRGERKVKERGLGVLKQVGDEKWRGGRERERTVGDRTHSLNRAM